MNRSASQSIRNTRGYAALRVLTAFEDKGIVCKDVNMHPDLLRVIEALLITNFAR